MPLVLKSAKLLNYKEHWNLREQGIFKTHFKVAPYSINNL